MNVSIIGTGNVGGALARTLSSAGHQIVVTSTTLMSQDNPGSVVDGTSNAEQVQSMVPGARVVKAFNTVLASRQADPQIADMPVDNFVAATDPAAKATVVDLVRSIGMRPIDAGPLEAARILEGMGALNISLNMQGGTWQNAWKLIEPNG